MSQTTRWACGIVSAGIGVFLLAGPAAGADDAAAMRQRLGAMRSLRDKLAARLERRIADDAAKGPCADYFLRFHEGADREEMHLTLRQRGGRWLAACAAVPYWRQESFQDQFRYIHRGRNGYVRRDKWRFAVASDGLAAKGDHLAGDAAVEVLIDQTRDERFPPGTPVQWPNTGEVFTWMERMNAVSHNTVRRQRYAIAADVSPAVHELALVLDGAVDKKSPLEVVFRVPAVPWLSPQVGATWWNCGRHAGDAAGAVLKDGRLSGELKVTFKPDQWFPKKPLEVTYVLDGRVDGPRCRGTYKASGGFGELTGTFDGECGQLVTGRFEAGGEMGRYGSQIVGRKLPVRTAMADLLKLGAEAPKTPAETAAALNELYYQVRALDMAFKQYPLPIEAALAQTAGTGPRWGPTAQPTAAELQDMLAWADEALRQAGAAAERADKAPYVFGLVGPGDSTFGPFYDAEPLKADGEAVYALPALEASGPQQWCYLPAWRVLGPLSHNDDYDRDFAELPEVLPTKARCPVDKLNFPRNLAPKDEHAFAQWQIVKTEGAKLDSPWQDIRRRGAFRGHSLFAGATVNAPKAADVWVAMAALEHGKLWVNEQLAWVSDERQWRNHAGREAVFRVHLRQGANLLLVRCREDRGEAWFRMHLCVRGGPAAAAPKAALADMGPVRGPLGCAAGLSPDADPPLAWDIDKGQNVAWAAELPAPADAGPVAVAGRLFYGVKPGGIVCADQQNGKVLWHDKDIALRALPAEQRTDWQAKIDAARKPDEKGRVVGMPGRWQTLLSDGKSIWAHHSFGVTVCLDAAGKQKWAVVTGLSDPAMLVVGDKVLLESGGPRARGAGGQPGRRLALDAATGQTLWQKDIPGGGGLHRLRLSGHASAAYMVASTAGQVFDCRDGRVVLGRFDIDPVPPPSQAKGLFSATEGFAWHFVDNDLYCAKLSTIHAVRFFMDPAGQVGCRVLWRNNYGIKYDSAIPVCAWGPWTLAVNMVQENCPGHSPAWRREVYVYDRLTGKPVVRLKPVLDNSQNWGASPATLPGRRLFVYDTGALIDNGQIAVVDVGAAQPHLLCRNFIPKGAAPPAFDGQRMFLRKGANIWCLAAATPEGKRYQQQRIAAQVIADILAVPPGAAALAAPEPLRELPKFDKAPRVPLTDGQGIAHWLVAAPLPPPKADQQAATDQKLASLRPALGEKLDLGGAGATFAPLPQDAVDLGYSWGHAYYLDGLGGTTAYPYCKIDLLRCTGGDPNRCGILYTLVDNPRDCQAVVDIPRHGIDVWVGGLKVRTGQALRLKQGVYPVLVRVRPECFERPLPPLDVQAALTEKTALPLSWPKQWMVAAAVPGSVGLLPPDKLASIPDKLDIGGQTYKLAARDADAQGNLELKDLGAVRDGKFASEQTAYCFAPLEADRDGTLVVNCSGDWWMLWYLDGNLVYSTLANGNGTSPKKLAAHSWSAALTKGKHVLTAVVRSGSQGWSVMSLGAIIDKPIDELRKEQIDPKAPLPPTKAAPVTFDLRDAPAAVLAARLRSARIRRAELDKIVASLPGTLEAAAAARWLKLLGGAKGN